MLDSLKQAGKNIGRGQTDNAQACYKNGVPTVRLPELGSEKGRIIPIS